MRDEGYDKELSELEVKLQQQLGSFAEEIQYLICDRACKNRACGHMIFAYFFTVSSHNFLYHYAMALKFSARSRLLIGIMIQVAEWNYTLPILRYDLESDGV